MSTPLSSTGRITIPYTVDGKLHKYRAYVRGLTLVGGVWKINTRETDSNDLLWSDAAEALALAISYEMATLTAPSDAVLEKLIGGVWIAQAYHTVAFTHHSATYGPGWGVITIFRDALYHKVKVVLEEPAEVEMRHNATRAGLGTAEASFVKEFCADYLTANAPYRWIVGRGNQYLAEAPFVGLTVAPNRKIRRARGLT